MGKDKILAMSGLALFIAGFVIARILESEPYQIRTIWGGDGALVFDPNSGRACAVVLFASAEKDGNIDCTPELAEMVSLIDEKARAAAARKAADAKRVAEAEAASDALMAQYDKRAKEMIEAGRVYEEGKRAEGEGVDGKGFVFTEEDDRMLLGEDNRQPEPRGESGGGKIPLSGLEVAFIYDNEGKADFNEFVRLKKEECAKLNNMTPEQKEICREAMAAPERNN